MSLFRRSQPPQQPEPDPAGHAGPPAIGSVSEGERWLRNWTNALMIDTKHDADKKPVQPWKNDDMATRMTVSNRLLGVRRLLALRERLP